MRKQHKPFLEVKEHLSLKYLPIALKTQRTKIKKNRESINIATSQTLTETNLANLNLINSENNLKNPSETQHIKYRRLPPMKYKNNHKTLTGRFVNNFYEVLRTKQITKEINREIIQMLKENNLQDVMQSIDELETNPHPIENEHKEIFVTKNNLNISKPTKKEESQTISYEKAELPKKVKIILKDKTIENNNFTREYNTQMRNKIQNIEEKPKILNNSFNVNLNKELSRVSKAFAKEDRLKKMKIHPQLENYFEQVNEFHSYKALKTILDKKKQHLLPMKAKDTSIDRLSNKIYVNYKPRTNKKTDIRAVRLKYTNLRNKSI